MQKSLFGVIIMMFLLLPSCAERNELAPVVDSKWREYNSKKTKHTVQSGETLYAIAFRYDKDYQTLADINHLHSPYTLKVGQVISLHPKVRVRNAKIYKKPVAKKIARPEAKPINFNGQWQWPVQGKIHSTFAPWKGRKGVNITGRKGEKIRAAAGGVVAYSGNGLPGYGNLIIIKHSNQFLTAYGNNSTTYVKEGQMIKPGQVIAQMGKVERKYWGLHFEIRKAGKPVNPLIYLKKA